jgi:hypothetical protein
MFKTYQAVTIEDAETVLYHTADSTGWLDWQLKYSVDRIGPGTEIFNGTQNTSDALRGTVHSSPTNPNITANNFVYWVLSGISGAVDQFNISVRYTVD